MRTYFFSGVPYVGSGELSFGIPKSNILCTDFDFVNSEFVDFSSGENLFVKVIVKAPSLKTALFLLSHALSLNNLDFLLEVSYICVTDNGKKSSRLLRSV